MNILFRKPIASNTTSVFFVMLCGLCFIVACKKNTGDVTNPYSNIPPVVQNDNPDVDDIPNTNFAWLHGKIFKPTCANSGCHDGSFEPEFRSISSSYNSLVNHAVISNDPLNSFQYRVVPYNADMSFIHARLTTEIPFTSGMMPLEVFDSDWVGNEDFYISKITDWINAGAKDMNGNSAPSATANTPPIVYGLAIFPHNNTTDPYPRQTDPPLGIGAIEVPSELVDVWIFAYDDNALLTQFVDISLKGSTSLSDFSTAIPTNFSLQSPIMALDFGNEPQSFYYKTTIDLSALAAGDDYYLRCYLDDGVQPEITEIPHGSSEYFWYLLFSLKVQ